MGRWKEKRARGGQRHRYENGQDRLAVRHQGLGERELVIHYRQSLWRRHMMMIMTAAEYRYYINLEMIKLGRPVY